eukprot:362619-Chlamydomonas_euryale.AAC.7
MCVCGCLSAGGATGAGCAVDAATRWARTGGSRLPGARGGATRDGVLRVEAGIRSNGQAALLCVSTPVVQTPAGLAVGNRGMPLAIPHPTPAPPGSQRPEHRAHRAGGLWQRHVVKVHQAGARRCSLP